jgi:hypothetical protein
MSASRKSQQSSSLRPGQAVPQSGQYGLRGVRGGDLGREVTGVAGRPLPPTPKPGQSYRLVDATKHQGR